MRSVRSAAQCDQCPSERDAASTLNDQFLLLLHQLLPLPHVFRHSRARRPPLRRKSAIAQSQSEVLRDARRFLLDPPQLDGGGLGQHVDHDRVNSVVSGEDVFDSGDARAAHHSGDVEQNRRVFGLSPALKERKFRRANLGAEGVRNRERWPENLTTVAVAGAMSFCRQRRNEVECMIRRVVEAELGLRGERKSEEMSSHNRREEKLLLATSFSC